MPELSIVIPCYNEEKRLNSSLTQSFEFLKQAVGSYEVIFVNDGSRDNTDGRIRSLSKGFENNYLILDLAKNMGKGKAIKEGILKAKGKFIVFTDADFSTPIETLGPAVKLLENGTDIVIASRRHIDSQLIVPQGKFRVFFGKCFTFLTNAWLNLGVSDATCGFKCFKREVASDLFQKQRQADWSFDAEILFLAKLRGYKVKEIPVNWTNHDGTKVNIAKDSFKSLLGLLRIRLNALRGFYR